MRHMGSSVNARVAEESMPVGAPEQQQYARFQELERLRRQEFLTPAAVTTLILLGSGYLPAFYPVFLPVMVVWLTIAVAFCGLAIAFSRSGYVLPGIVLYMCGVMIFYFGAVFLVPGITGHLSYTMFTAGNSYYFVLGVLPVFASTLLLDGIGPWIVNAIVLTMTEYAVWGLPHNASFYAFTGAVGGTIFLSGSVALGQIMLFAFAFAIVTTLRRALNAAIQLDTLTLEHQRVASQQAQIEHEIRLLQEAHANIANGQPVRINLQPGSELYPIAVSLNIMVDRLTNLNRSEQDLTRIQHALGDASQIVHRIGQGDLTAQPAPTGTMVDGLIVALIQVQGQIATWVQGLSSAIAETQHNRFTMHEAVSDIVLAIRKIEEICFQLPPQSTPALQEVITLARQNAEHLLQLLEINNRREQSVTSAISQIRLATSTGLSGSPRLAPRSVPPPGTMN